MKQGLIDLMKDNAIKEGIWRRDACVQASLLLAKLYRTCMPFRNVISRYRLYSHWLVTCSTNALTAAGHHTAVVSIERICATLPNEL